MCTNQNSGYEKQAAGGTHERQLLQSVFGILDPTQRWCYNEQFGEYTVYLPNIQSASCTRWQSVHSPML